VNLYWLNRLLKRSRWRPKLRVTKKVHKELAQAGVHGAPNRQSILPDSTKLNAIKEWKGI
jgi:hypothetical protein